MTEVMTEVMSKIEELKQLTILGTKNVLSVKDLSLYCGLAVSTIYNLVSAKKIPHYKNEGGKLTFFKKSDIDKWLCACYVPTTTEMEQQAVKHCLDRSSNGCSGHCNAHRKGGAK